MLWKRKAPPPKPASIKPPTVESPKTREEQLEEVADKLAASLSNYREAAYRASNPAPSEELKAAREKIKRAEELVLEGGLALALGRYLPEHVKYWATWSQKEDFRDWVGFDATQITATESEEEGGSGTATVVTIDFVFNDTIYRLILRDYGMSPVTWRVPGGLDQRGEIELFTNDLRVAKFGLAQDRMKDYPEWGFTDVRALKVGPWMKDVIDMATQIEASARKQFDEALNTRIRETARDINFD